MRKSLILALALLGIAVAIPAISLGGGGKKLVDKNTARKNKNNETPVAVATGFVNNPGTMQVSISTQPKRKKVQYRYQTLCYKGASQGYDPQPGTPENQDKTRRSKIKFKLGTAMPNPDRCKVQASGKLLSGKNVTVKITNKP